MNAQPSSIQNIVRKHLDVKSAAEVKAERAAEAPALTKIGQNSAGDDVYLHNKYGIRAYVPEGMDFEQAGLMASKGRLNTPQELFRQGQHKYLTTEELAAFKAGGDADSPASSDVLHSSGGNTAVPFDPNKPAMPQGKLRAKDAAKISDVIAALEKAFDVPIRVGKFRDKALGIWKPDAEVIRLGWANNIKTAVHEIGHHLQDMLFPGRNPLRPFKDELLPIATKPKSGQSPLPEGFAEFVAKYVVNPDEARQLAPRFYDHFEQALRQAPPEIGKALLDARKGVERWAKQPAALEVLSHVSMEEKGPPGLLRRIFKPETWDSLYTNFIDRFYPLKKARDYLADGKELPADMDVYVMAGCKKPLAFFLHLVYKTV